jgi:hypothetical protein
MKPGCMRIFFLMAGFGHLFQMQQPSKSKGKKSAYSYTFFVDVSEWINTYKNLLNKNSPAKRTGLFSYWLKKFIVLPPFASVCICYHHL